MTKQTSEEPEYWTKTADIAWKVIIVENGFGTGTSARRQVLVQKFQGSKGSVKWEEVPFMNEAN